jgi:hypothetical protein
MTANGLEQDNCPMVSPILWYDLYRPGSRFESHASSKCCYPTLVLGKIVGLRRDSRRCGTLVSRIVCRVDVFKPKRPDRRHLRNVLARFRPMKVGGIAGQNDHSSGWVRPQLIGLEFVTEANIKNTGNDCVNAIFRMLVWHQFHAMRDSNSHHVLSRPRWLTDNNREPDGRRKGSEGLPFDVLAEDRLESRFARLMRSQRFFQHASNKLNRYNVPIN